MDTVWLNNFLKSYKLEKHKKKDTQIRHNSADMHLGIIRENQECYTWKLFRFAS